jgi:hypothetical protein
VSDVACGECSRKCSGKCSDAAENAVENAAMQLKTQRCGRTNISPHLTTSHHISPHLTTSYHISPHLATSHHISPHLTTSHHILPHLTTSHHISPHLTASHCKPLLLHFFKLHLDVTCDIEIIALHCVQYAAFWKAQRLHSKFECGYPLLSVLYSDVLRSSRTTLW